MSELRKPIVLDETTSKDPLAPARGYKNVFIFAMFFWAAVVIAVLLLW